MSQSPVFPAGHDPHAGRLFEWVVEHADDGYLILDGGGRVVAANGTARADLGLPAPSPRAAPFWRTVAATHAVIGGPDADGPAYLIRPETDGGLGVWHRVERLPVPDAFGGRTVVRLRDVTDERRMRQSLWAYRAMQKYGIKLRVPKSGALAQTAEPGRGVRPDEWLRVLQTWVSLAAPTGSQVLVVGPLPAGGLVLPMDGFALLAAELLQFVRHPSRDATEDARAATVVLTAENDRAVLTARCPVRHPNAAELRQRWTPQYRGRAGGPLASDPDTFTGEAASLVWNVGGGVDTRADPSAGWAEVTLTVPTQPPETVDGQAVHDDHSLIGA